MMDSGCVSQQSSNASECQRIYNQKPTGENDCENLVYLAADIFDPDSLIVRLDGITLDPSQYIIETDNKTFTLIVDATDINALHSPLDSEECLRIDYNKLAQSDTSGCISILN